MQLGSDDFFTIRSEGRSVCARGTVAGLRRLFWARSDEGIDVLSNRADVLAFITKSRISTNSLIWNTLIPAAPHPFEQSTIFEDVQAIPAGHYALLSKQGEIRSSSFWTMPSGTAQLERTALELRLALERSIECRLTDGVVGADLSGGMDSTPLAMLAAEKCSRKITLFTTRSHSPGDDDMYWALRTLEALEVRKLEIAGHLVPELSDVPLPFSGIGDTRCDLDTPFVGVINRGKIERAAELLYQNGVTEHVTGNGGDEVLAPPPNYIFAPFTTGPRVQMSHIRAAIAQRRTNWRLALKCLTSNEAYSSWLEKALSGVTTGRIVQGPHYLERWGTGHLSAPQWLSKDSKERLRQEIEGVVATVHPLDTTPYRHSYIDAIQRSACATRSLRQIYAAHGVHIRAPLLERRVIEACAKTIPEESGNPWKYKPLMVAASRPWVPSEILSRVTKSDLSPTVYAGLRQNCRQIDALMSRGRLEDCGIIDSAALSMSMFGESAPPPPIAIARTLAIEKIMRDLGH
ncbi:asparagine synthase-related protein [Pseudonocardia sp. ICBG1142]|uniref:asparagine synthase-related protein n=1 Tax=Pseudonocardia sp. ICBG1142 TaxID=2846760 RepID=UPI0035A8E885